MENSNLLRPTNPSGSGLVESERPLPAPLGDDPQVTERSCKPEPKITKCARLGIWNMRSSFDEERVRQAMRDGRLDALFLSELRKPNSPSLTELDPVTFNFTHHPPNKDPLTHEGWAILSKYVGFVTRYPIINHRFSETGRVLSVDCRVDGHIFRFVSVYVPPAIRRHAALAGRVFNEIQEVAEDTPSSTELVIGGDFNARIGFGRSPDSHIGIGQLGGVNLNSPHLLDLLLASNLSIPASFLRVPWRNRWTWRHAGGNAYQIDHFLCPTIRRGRFRKITARRDIAGGSDHRLVLAIMDLPSGGHPSPRPNHRSLQYTEDRDVVTAYREQLAPLQQLLDSANNNPADVLRKGTRIIKAAVERSFTTAPKSGDHISADLLEAQRALGAHIAGMEGRVCRRKDKRVLKALRRKVEHLKRRDERARLRQLVRDLEAAAKTGRHFEVIRNAEPQQTRRRHPIKVGGRVYHSTEDIAKLHADRLAQRGETDQSPLPAPSPTSPPASPPDFGPLTLEEVKEALKQLSNKRTGGPDGIVAEALKLGGSLTAEWIYQVLSPCWENPELMPAELCATNVVMIPKKGKDPTNLDSYRPISLTTCVLRVLERIILGRLQTLYESRLDRVQAGFVRSRQISEHILTIKSLAEQALASNEHFSAVFVDLSQAYDLVSRDKLFACLSHHGTPVSCLRLVEAIYQLTSFRVRYGSSISTTKRSSRGVLQGSTLSPIFFNLYLQTLLEETFQEWDSLELTGLAREKLEEAEIAWPPTARPTGETLNIRLLAYADDLTLLGKNDQEAAAMTGALMRACARYGLTISASKSSWTRLGHGRASFTGPRLCIPGFSESIPYSKSTKYLGTMIDEDADDATILDARIKAAWRAYGRHKKFLTNKAVPRSTRIRFARSTVFSVLTFGTEVLTLRHSAITRIQRFEDKIYRCILNMSWSRNIPKDKVREAVNRCAPTDFWLAQRVRLLRLQLVGHVLRSATICRDLLFSRSPNQKKGRKKSFMSQIAQDLSLVKTFTHPDPITVIARDRVRYRRACADYVRDRGEAGRLVCRLCDKEYITNGPFVKHQRTCGNPPETTTTDTDSQPR